jgi:hypothetical protein
VETNGDHRFTTKEREARAEETKQRSTAEVPGRRETRASTNLVDVREWLCETALV